MSNEQERAAFEDWYADWHSAPRPWRGTREEKWAVWQARAALAATPAPAPKATRTDSIAFQYLREEVAKEVAPVKAAFAQKAATPAPAPLTDEQIDGLNLAGRGVMSVRDMVRVVERAHGIGGDK